MLSVKKEESMRKKMKLEKWVIIYTFRSITESKICYTKNLKYISVN